MNISKKQITLNLNINFVYALFIFLIFVWGLSWPIAKIGLNFVPAVWYAAFRLISATVFMFVIAFFTKRLVLPTKKDWPIILTLGILQIGLLVFLNTIGLDHVPPGRSSVLVFTTPLWILPISVIFFGEPHSWIKWGSFALGLLGIALLFNPNSMNWHDYDTVLGNLILLASALCWALAILAARHMKWHRSPMELMPWQLLIGTIPVVSYAFMSMPHPQIAWNLDSILSIFFIGFFGTALGLLGATIISKELPPFTTSINFLVIPVVSVIFSALMVHEKITLTIAVGITLIIFGTLLLALEKKADLTKRTP